MTNCPKTANLLWVDSEEVEEDDNNKEMEERDKKEEVEEDRNTMVLGECLYERPRKGETSSTTSGHDWTFIAL